MRSSTMRLGALARTAAAPTRPSSLYAAAAAASPAAAVAAARSCMLPPVAAASVPVRRFASITSFDPLDTDPTPPPSSDPFPAPEAFTPPVHPRRRESVHGIGVPSVRTVQGIKPRRLVRPHGIQAVPQPMKTFTEGPRELGHPVIRSYFGKVTSTKMQKTIAVEVAQFYKHPKYRKYIRTSKKFLAHDENEECREGDVVEIRVARRFSKRKHYQLFRVVRPKLPIDVAADRHISNLPKWKIDEINKLEAELQGKTEQKTPAS